MTNQLSPAETAERDRRIAALTRAGYTAPQIAMIVHVTPRTVARVRVRTGVARPFCGMPFTDEEAARAAAMLDDGASYGEVARTLHRSRETIMTRLPKRSTFKPGGGQEFRHYLAALDAIRPPIDVEVAS